MAESSMKIMSAPSNVSASNIQASISSQMGSKVSSKSQASNFSDFMNKSTNTSDSTKQSAKTNASVNDVKNTMKQGTQQTDSAATQSSTKTDSDNVTASTVTEVDSKVLEEAESELKEQISDVLGIDVEELEKVMAESGLVTADLLNPDVLKTIMFEVNDVQDPSELLTNEDLLNTLTELQNVISDISEDSPLVMMQPTEEMMPAEEFATMLESAKETQANPENVENVAETESTDTVQTNQPVITVEKEDAASTHADARQSKNGKNSNSTLNQSNSVNQFVEQLVNATEGVEGTENVTFSNVQEMQDIVNQVVDQIKFKISTDVTSAQMQLNPENLGKVNISVVAKNGQMTATFAVENQIAKDALESQMVALKDSLSEQGLKVDAIEVTINPEGFEQNNFSDQQQGGYNSAKKGSSRHGFKELDEDEEEETEDDSVTNLTGQGQTVDFSA